MDRVRITHKNCTLGSVGAVIDLEHLRAVSLMRAGVVEALPPEKKPVKKSGGSK